MTNVGGLQVDSVTVTNFRCYGFARLTAGGRMTVLYGPNGAGKTNLLEAISLLSPVLKGPTWSRKSKKN